MEKIFLDSLITQLNLYKNYGDKTFEQLTEDQMAWQYNEESNSIAILIQHLHGNMMSRFTDFLTKDGEKDWRRRDLEFSNERKTKEELLRLWEEGWNHAFKAIRTLQPEDLTKTITVNKKPFTVAAALQNYLAHYAAHIGQMMYAGKMLRDDQWISLSIPRVKK